MEVVALKELRYSGTQRAKGEKFEVSDKDAKILSLIGKVQRASEPEQEPEQEDDAPKPRRYKTRHMKAED